LNQSSLEQIDKDRGLWRVSGDTNGYLIVRGDESLLIDCPMGPVAELLAQAGLPAPSRILHTHVQAEHCGEWHTFPSAKVFVPTGQEDLARLTPNFIAQSRTVWAADRNWDDRGAEPYGIAGCLTARPPEKPLAVSGTLVPGVSFTWQDVQLEVISLPGSGNRSIGLFWREAGVLFSGDLLLAGGYCVNLYDIERCYGIPTGYEELRTSLETVKNLAPATMCPSTGPLIVDASGDIDRWFGRTNWMSSGPVRRADRQYALTNYEPRRVFGNYREVMPGLYQQTNFGNVILYIDASGDGLMIDPGPCYWLPTWHENCAAMNADFDLMEKEAGLRGVTNVLITHFHGDHVESADVVRKRYGARVLATPDIAAVLERPEEFPYPCQAPWYGFPFDTVKIDEVLQYGESVMLGEHHVTPVHLPGHCYVHAGYVIPWMGEVTVCTGDVIQYGDGPIGCGAPIIYNDAGSPGATTAESCRRLSKYHPTVLVGGHSHSCKDPDGSVLKDLTVVSAETDANVAAMVPPGMWEAATMPPGYADARRRLAG
jgi:glyoxylase-like metal-dependent hydrolase (beta-lactamase superfamily II)